LGEEGSVAVREQVIAIDEVVEIAQKVVFDEDIADVEGVGHS
jgi:hypothetical protein